VSFEDFETLRAGMVAGETLDTIGKIIIITIVSPTGIEKCNVCRGPVEAARV
jgi:hypothetical protein